MAAALEMDFSARMSMKELDDLAKAIRALLARFEAPHPAAKAPEVIDLRKRLLGVEYVTKAKLEQL